MKFTSGFTWFFIVIGLLVVAGGPIAVLFSLNTLFPALAIPYTFYTWMATFVLMALITADKDLK